jgi:hypothetical protein
MRSAARLSPILLLTALGACRPEIGEAPSSITGPRILAVRGEPPESSPGEEVTYEVLVASPAGTLLEPEAYWALCLTPRPLAENNSVNDACWREAYLPIGGPSRTITAATPEDACQLFGPETPPGDYRPRDPDITGGFYQPVRVAIPELAAFGFERVTCNLANAPADIAVDFRERYLPNRNPELTALTARDADLAAVPAGARVELELGWTPESAEVYPVFDAAAQALVDRREALRVSWYATAGSFEADRTGRGEDEAETFTRNTWTAPAEPAAVHLWVVLRDSRGGVSFSAHDAVVR